jgi:50S ribosomal protein L16 3-hydroxylase
MTSFYLSTPYDPPEAPETLPLSLPWALLGGISPKAFMRDYWQKKPLLVRGAIPAFSLAEHNKTPLDSPISSKALFAMASDQDIESRLIQSSPRSFAEGPIQKKHIPSLDTKNWTLLLQGMEAKHPAAKKILSWFRFIPDARLDDLMISIAGHGGGVGPHFDSYDVFLIQMSGRRRWQISGQKDLSLNPNLPLKILQRFKPEQTWDLLPGDMLYLPPHIAHDGTALDGGCQTWSVGFRSATYKELLQEGLWRLAESLEDIPELNEHFSDPKQMATSAPEKLPAELIKQIELKLKGLHFNKASQFLPGIAAYLSEPKAQTYFEPPKTPLNFREFQFALKSHLLRPHPQSRLITHGSTVYCNGEDMTAGQSTSTQKAWLGLASKQFIKNIGLPKPKSQDSLFEAFCAGWLIFDY